MNLVTVDQHLSPSLSLSDTIDTLGSVVLMQDSSSSSPSSSWHGSSCLWTCSAAVVDDNADLSFARKIIASTFAGTREQGSLFKTMPNDEKTYSAGTAVAGKQRIRLASLVRFWKASGI